VDDAPRPLGEAQRSIAPLTLSRFGNVRTATQRDPRHVEPDKCVSPVLDRLLVQTDVVDNTSKPCRAHAATVR
jgi:hypothetical protein